MSLQTDPAHNDFVVRFNGQPVHDACRGYLAAGTLPLPVSRYATTSAFRGINDAVLSYRMAGSFVLFLTDRFGMAALLSFMRASARDDSIQTIRSHVEEAFGVSLEQAEAEWLTALRQS